jgi:tetratricopeptide (TPR) repeat protein/CHAT domain-containing protein
MLSAFDRLFKQFILLLTIIGVVIEFSLITAAGEDQKDVTNEVFLKVMPTLNAQLEQAMDLTDAGKFQDAINLLNKSLSICAANNGKQEVYTSYFWNQKGLCEQELGKDKEASQSIENCLAIRLLKLGPDHPQTMSDHKTLGLIYDRLNEPEKAIYHFEKIVSANPNKEETKDDVGHCFSILGRLHVYVGNYEKSIKYYGQAIDFFSKKLGEKHPQLAFYNSEIAFSYQLKKDIRRAIFHYERAFELNIEKLRANPAEIANRLNLIGDLYSNNSEYNKALINVERALAIRLKVFGEEHIDVAISYTNVGNLYTKLGDYGKALPLHEKSIAIRLGLFPKGSPEIAVGYSNLGTAYSKLGNFKKAKEYWTIGLNSDLESFGKNHPRVIQGYIYIGFAYNRLGQPQKALEQHETALLLIPLSKTAIAITLDATGNYGALLGDVYIHLAADWEDLGNYPKALGFLQKCLAIRSKNKGPTHIDIATVHNNLGNVYNSLGESYLAQVNFEKALGIMLPKLGREHPNIATCLSNLGMIKHNMGATLEAIKLLEEALEIQKKTLEPDHIDLATTYNNLMSPYVFVGNYRKAKKCYEEVLRISLKVFGRKHPRIAVAHSNGAFLYRNFGDYENAIRLYHKALELEKELRGKEHPGIGSTLNAIGVAHLFNDEPELAIPSITEGIRIRSQTLGGNHPVLISAYEDLMTAYFKGGHYSKAIRFAEVKQKLDEQFISKIFAYLPEQKRLDFMRNRDPFFLLGNLKEANMLGLIALRRKGLVLDSILEDRRLVQHKNTPQIDSLLLERNSIVSKWQKLVNASDIMSESKIAQVEALENKMLELDRHSEAITGIKKQARRALNLEIKNLKEKLYPSQVLIDFIRYNHIVKNKSTDALIGGIGAVLQVENGKCSVVQVLSKGAAGASREINERDEILSIAQEHDEFVSIKGASLSQIVKLLQGPIGSEVRLLIKPSASSEMAKKVRLERMRIKSKNKDMLVPSFGALIHSSKSISPNWVPLGEAVGVGKELKALKASHQKGGVGAKMFSQKLHGKLIAPILDHLPDNTKTLIICSDAELNFVPFPALIDQEGNFLCEKYEILNVSAGRDLVFGSETQTKSKEVIIFANPSFDGKSTNQENALAMREVDRNAMRDLSFAPLPGTMIEATKVSSLTGRTGLTSSSFIGTKATERSLSQINSPKILHLATHGFFISSEMEKDSGNQWSFLNENKFKAPISNPMHRSGLALAGAKNTLNLWEEGKFVDPANDGILTAEEASQLDLRDTWLTVLSACDTGSGVARAGEGVLGLRRAFAMAGTQNLLLTLWPVDDSFTKDFMVSFYKEALKTGNAPKAMAKVQKEWLIKLREERSVSQAVKLAGPFVLTFRGNPELN